MADSFLDTLLALPAMGRAALSPDGRRVAWTWYRKAPAADIYVGSTDGSADPLYAPRPRSRRHADLARRYRWRTRSRDPRFRRHGQGKRQLVPRQPARPRACRDRNAQAPRHLRHAG